MNVGFIINDKKDKDYSYSNSLIEYLMNKGCNILISSDIAKKSDLIKFSVLEEDVYRNSDFIVSIGGDGTILSVARNAAIYKTPILGINCGYLGYLADIEKSDGKMALDKVLNNQYRIEKRMMLQVEINNKELSLRESLALNDVAISNNKISRMIEIDLSIDDDYIDNYRADGIIVASPTGSTAYNLSAGGPILKPTTNLIAVSLVCPHTLYTRPFVISGNESVKIRIGERYDDVMLSLDGQTIHYLTKGDEVTVSASEYTTDLIKTTNNSFYDIMRHKMMRMGCERN